MIKSVAGLYFSPSGEAAKITKKISRVVMEQLEDATVGELQCDYQDMLKKCSEQRKHFAADEDMRCDACEFDSETVVVIGVPAASGRLMEPCVDMLKHINGGGAFAVVVVTYGNNTYGDSLYELYSLAEEAGFNVASAAAFVAQNAIFGSVAGDRPDAHDLEKIIEFARISANKIKRLSGTSVSEMRIKPAPLDIKGSMPSRKPVKIPLHPSVNSFCINCGKCIDVCPMGAINREDPFDINLKKCISCTACINACEQDARGFSGPMYTASKLAFEIFSRKRRDPEWFI